RNRADIGPVVRPGDGDRDRLRDEASMGVVESDVIFLDDALADGEMLRGRIVDCVAPAERAVRRIRGFRYRSIDAEGAEARRVRWVCGGAGRVGVAEVDIVEGDRSANRRA